MALVRILVDGYSLLHNWPELAPGKPRHSMEARDELIRVLTLYRDATTTPTHRRLRGRPRSEESPVSLENIFEVALKAFATLGYQNGVIGNIHVSWSDPNKVREVVAVGSRRRGVFNDLNDMERVRCLLRGSPWCRWGPQVQRPPTSQE